MQDRYSYDNPRRLNRSADEIMAPLQVKRLASRNIYKENPVAQALIKSTEDVHKFAEFLLVTGTIFFSGEK